MTAPVKCSDWLPEWGRTCQRDATFWVEWDGGPRPYPKCAIHARRYRDPDWRVDLGWPAAHLTRIAAHP